MLTGLGGRVAGRRCAGPAASIPSHYPLANPCARLFTTIRTPYLPHLPAIVSMLQLPTVRQRRSDYPDTANLCEHCTAKCCHYFALPIDEPTERQDFDFIRWYLLHDRATVFVDDGTWFLLVHTTCKHLLPDFRCGIYETRPRICRDYTTEKCEFENDWCYEQYFETAEQIDEYAEAMFGPDPVTQGTPEGCVRGRKPVGLPMA